MIENLFEKNVTPNPVNPHSVRWDGSAKFVGEILYVFFLPAIYLCQVCNHILTKSYFSTIAVSDAFTSGQPLIHRMGRIRSIGLP